MQHHAGQINVPKSLYTEMMYTDICYKQISIKKEAA